MLFKRSRSLFATVFLDVLPQKIHERISELFSELKLENLNSCPIKPRPGAKRDFRYFFIKEMNDTKRRSIIYFFNCFRYFDSSMLGSDLIFGLRKGTSTVNAVSVRNVNKYFISFRISSRASQNSAFQQTLNFT